MVQIIQGAIMEVIQLVILGICLVMLGFTIGSYFTYKIMEKIDKENE
jgi:uncharacterized protein YneF (UPF0154 family)